MTTGLPNPLPHGITEADLIDLADGVLARDREDVVLGALKSDPRLGLLAKQFRADRELVAGLGEVRAPAGLAEGIEARLEAAALRDLASASRDVPRPIPISQVERREPSVLRLLMESAWPRRLAVAASLAIVAGLGTLGVRELMRKPAIAFSPPPNDYRYPPTPPPPFEVVTKPAVETEPTPTPTIIAAKPITEPAGMTDARAAMLASEGRLAITLSTSIAAPAIKRLDALTHARDTGWRTIALESVPTQYAALLTPTADTRPAPTRPDTPDPATIVGDHGTPAPIVAPTPTLPPLHAVVKALYTVDLAPGEKSLAALVRSITESLPEGVTLSLRELPQSIAAPVAVDPDSVLWWNSPVGKWSRRASVPIVVEGLE